MISLNRSAITGFSVGHAVVTANVGGLSGTLAVSVVPPMQENLGIITAGQAHAGLGFNVTPDSDQEFALAAAAGATHVRFQCGWATAELQSAPPLNQVASPRYALQPYCQSALASARRYGLHPTIVAGYGSPYHAILSVTIPGGARRGAQSIDVQLSSGAGGDTLYSARANYDNILRADNSQITGIHSYAGGLIASVQVRGSDHATLQLASALTSDLPADTKTLYTINEALYPPPATFSPYDPSVQAFAEYAEFLSGSIAQAGLSGEVELWNEPTWPDDPWDDRFDFFDNLQVTEADGPQRAYLPNWGFVAALLGHRAPAGVTYIWAGTEKSGTNSVLDPQMGQNTGVAFLSASAATFSESFHPYGNNPEDALWSAPCLANSTGNNDFFGCNLFGGPGGNFSLAAQRTALLRRSSVTAGVNHNITETGFGLLNGDAAHQTRFIMRQFLGYEAAGVSPIEFYRLYDSGPDKVGFIDPITYRPYPAYLAVEGLVSDLARIAAPPVAPYTAASLSSVANYHGNFPLDSVHLVGSRPGDTRNSEMLTLWQRSYVANGAKWGTLAQPAPVPVTINIPTGSVVAAVLNLDTRISVPYTSSGHRITFPVSDDPIEVLIEP